MYQEITGSDLFKFLSKKYVALLAEETKLMEGLKKANDDYDFNIYALDENTCVLRFNANEKNYHTHPELVVYRNEHEYLRVSHNYERLDIIDISMPGLLNIFAHYKKHRELYMLMNSRHVIEIDEDKRIFLNETGFNICDNHVGFNVSYYGENHLQTFDNTHRPHKNINYAGSFHFVDMMQIPFDIEKIPEYFRIEMQKEQLEEEKPIEQIKLELIELSKKNECIAFKQIEEVAGSLVDDNEKLEAIYTFLEEKGISFKKREKVLAITK